VSNWKKKTHKKYAQQKKKEIDLFIEPSNKRFNFERDITPLK